MGKTRVHHFQCLLQRGRDDLLSRLSHVAESGVTSCDYGRDEVDRAKSAEAQELFSRLSTQDREMLETIERALRRVNEGTFGICVVCQREIGAKRLEAVPWAMRCIDCQQRIER